MADEARRQKRTPSNPTCKTQEGLSFDLQATTAKNPSAAGRLRVLIADDQLIASEVLKRLLKNEQEVEVVGTCSNGPETLEKIKSLHPDLVFLDVQMPGMDGFEVVEKLPPGESPMIVFVTANELHAGRARKVRADFVLKPCTRDLVRTAVRRALARQEKKTPGEDF